MTTEAGWVEQGRLRKAEESSSWERTHRSGASAGITSISIFFFVQSQELGKLSIVYLIPSL